MVKLKELTGANSVRAGCKVYIPSDNMEYLIIQQLYSHVGAGLKKFHCTKIYPDF
jgi:hypothetical protein